MALDATVGGASSNSYVTLVEANAHFAEKEETAWNGSDAKKEAALIHATEWLDASYRFIGSIVSTSQALSWPRKDVVDHEGREIAEDVIPYGVKHATYAAALVIIVEGSLLGTQKRGGMVKREKVGELEVEYMNGAPSGNTYPHIANFLNGFLIAANKVRRS